VKVYPFASKVDDPFLTTTPLLLCRPTYFHATQMIIFHQYDMSWSKSQLGQMPAAKLTTGFKLQAYLAVVLIDYGNQCSRFCNLLVIALHTKFSSLRAWWLYVNEWGEI
jgi:hypothetical protein